MQLVRHSNYRAVNSGAAAIVFDLYMQCSDGSVIDWFGVKKAAYYSATRSAYAKIDVSLKYSSLFIVADSSLPPISGKNFDSTLASGTDAYSFDHFLLMHAGLV